MFSLRPLLTFTILSIAVVEGRFGQENAVQGIISAIGGNGGQAATLAGQSISTLLAGSNACDKLRLADQVAALEGDGAIDAAKALVQAEKNFNPFAVDRPNICDDVGLPETQALRGILPLIDPAVPGADAINTASEASLTNPLNQNGLSQAGLLIAQGFTTFNAQSSDGQLTPADGGAVGGDDNEGGDNVDNGNNNNGDDVDNGNNNDGDNADNGNNTDGGNADNGNNDGGNVDNGDVGNDGGDNQCPPLNTGGASTTTDLQSFDGNLGAPADSILFSGDSKRPFQVAGTSFLNFAAAATRTCDRQFNACANAANGGADFSVSDCTDQKTACTAAQNSAPVKSFARRKRSVRRSKQRREARKLKRHLRLKARYAKA